MSGSVARAGGAVPTGSLLGFLGALSAFGPISTDVYLPGIPALAQSLHTSPSLAQLTISVCLLGLAGGQVIGGIASDVHGRRGPLLIGLALYVATSIGCASAPGIGILLGFRLLQGMCGGVGVAIARAIVRDRARGDAAARVYGLLLVIAGFGPIGAPILGGLLLRVTDWRGIFITLAAIGGVLLAVAARLIAESLPAEERRAGALAETRAAFTTLAGDRRFVGHTTVCSLAQAVAIAYIAGSPFVLERSHHLSTGQFSLLFAGISCAGMLVRIATLPITRRFGPGAVLRGSCWVQSAGAAGVLLVTVMHAGLVPLVAVLVVAVGSAGAILPTGVGLAMEDHPRLAGSASGLFGFAQSIVAGGVAPLVGIAGARATLPMAVVMATCAWSALVVLQMLDRGTWNSSRSSAPAPRLLVRGIENVEPMTTEREG